MTQTELLPSSNNKGLRCQSALKAHIARKGFLARVSNRAWPSSHGPHHRQHRRHSGAEDRQLTHLRNGSAAPHLAEAPPYSLCLPGFRPGGQVARIIASSTLLITLLALSLPTEVTAGNLIGTFVSGEGDDTNPCTEAFPCRTFAGAYVNTASGGIISALDAADYGPLTITGPITINGNNLAAITTPSGGLGIGITIRAGASDKIALLGLTVNGANDGGAGVEFISGASLTVEHCSVSGIHGTGLIFISQETAMHETFDVSDSHFYGNAGSGISIQSGTGSAAIVALIDRTDLTDNGGHGLEVLNLNGSTAPVIVVARDSIAAFNGFAGFYVGASTGSASLSLTRCKSAGNVTGVEASQSGTLSLSQCTVMANQTGYNADNGGVISSYGDNDIIDTNNIGILTPVSKE
jgi:hypothetical protein